MAKQIVIKKDSLPPLDANSSAYLIRFRIISEDKSNVSYWSPIYSLPVSVSYVVSSVTINHNSGITVAAWQPVVDISDYDVFVSWSGSAGVYNWQYYGRVNGTSVTLAAPAGLNKFSIRVFRPSQSPNSAVSSFLIYETLDSSV